jgi:hypothetical protein
MPKLVAFRTENNRRTGESRFSDYSISYLMQNTSACYFFEVVKFLVVVLVRKRREMIY